MSRRPHYGRFSRPSSEVPAVEAEQAEKAPRRPANVYDAVAGRVTQAGLIGNVNDVKSSRQPLRPDEVLFKQANAPVRYEETDYYDAHARLPADQQLPSGELLTAIHAYVSKLYSRTTHGDAQPAWKCMDETALIAFGILMEETAREILGETGDFAFVEAADEEEEKILAPAFEEKRTDLESPEPRETSPRATSVEVDEVPESDDSRYSLEKSDESD